MTYRRWDVVVVSYPFIEADTAKRRPALIVSSDALHVTHGVYWIVMITTAKAGIRAQDILVTNHSKAGLPADCVVRVPRLTTANEAQIVYRRGSITAKDRNAVAALLKQYVP